MPPCQEDCKYLCCLSHFHMLPFALESFLQTPGGSESKLEFLVTTPQSPG